MRAWAIVALVAVAGARPAAQDVPWSVDVGGSTLVEAWDRNQARESLAGGQIGITRHVWRPLFVRVEGLVLHASQTPESGWLGGFTVGPRARWLGMRGRPFFDLGVGFSRASTEIPPGGTASNYVIVSGAGVGVPLGRASLELAARWLHLSNNGREGRHRNPDIQALGVVVAIGWIP